MEAKQEIKKLIRRIPFGKKLVVVLYPIYCYFRNRKRKEISNNHFGIFNVELTNHCPMRCVMCPRTYKMTRRQGLMTFDIFKKIIDELIISNPDYVKHSRVWLHHFGESLQHPQFDTFIRYAADKGVRTCLSLNPFMLNEERAEKLIHSGLYLAYLSLDGSDDESFYQIRGLKQAYEVSKVNALQFLEMKKRYQTEMKIVLSMINFEKNRLSIRKTKDFWKKQQGLDEFLIKPFGTWTGDIKEINEMSGNFPGKKKNGPVVCNFPWETMSVTWDGTVVPCCTDYNSFYPLGNINVQSLSAIWNGEPMQQLRKQFINNTSFNPLCRNCEDLHSISNKL